MARLTFVPGCGINAGDGAVKSRDAAGIVAVCMVWLDNVMMPV